MDEGRDHGGVTPNGSSGSAARTISFDPTEWQAVTIANLERLYAFARSLPALNGANAQTMREHLERTKYLVTAWEKSCPAEIRTDSAILSDAEIQELIASDPRDSEAQPASTSVKRKGGWPLGKKRGTRKKAEGHNQPA